MRQLSKTRRWRRYFSWGILSMFWNLNGPDYHYRHCYLVGIELCGIEPINRKNISLMIQVYPKGAYCPSHSEDFLLNQGRELIVHSFELTKAKKGGQFQSEIPHKKFWRYRCFNGSKNPHWVTKVEEGTRRVLIFQYERKLRNVQKSSGIH